MTPPAILEGVTHHSFSSINAYVNICPLQYFYKYIERRPEERRSAALGFGSAVNQGLVSIDADLAAGRTPDLALAQEAFHDRLRREFENPDVPVDYPEDESFESFDQKGRAMIAFYVERLDPEERPLPSQVRRFTVPIQDASGEVLQRPLTGEFDRVLDAGEGKRAIVDWKTAGKRWTSDELDRDLQPTVYLYAARLLFGKEASWFRYDFLLKTKTPAIEPRYVHRTATHRARFIRLVREVEKGVNAGVFPPRDKSWACKGCPYRSRCDLWQD